MQSRLPTILRKAIEDATCTLDTQSSEERVADLVHTIDRMGDLMTDLSGNAKLRPIMDDDEADVALWNKEIARYFQGDLSCRLCDTVIGYTMMSCSPKTRISWMHFGFLQKPTNIVAVSSGVSTMFFIDKRCAHIVMFMSFTYSWTVRHVFSFERCCLWIILTFWSLQSTGDDHLTVTEKNILGNNLNRLWKVETRQVPLWKDQRQKWLYSR